MAGNEKHVHSYVCGAFTFEWAYLASKYIMTHDVDMVNFEILYSIRE